VSGGQELSLLVPTVLACGALGFVAGWVVLLLDPQAPHPRTPGSSPSAAEGIATGVPTGTLLQRFFASLSIGLFWLPVVGLVLGAIAVIANWRLPAWPRTVSRIGAGLGAVATGICLLLLAK